MQSDEFIWVGLLYTYAMVEFEATIEVTQWREIDRTNKMDGSDKIKGNVTLEENRTVHIDEEFPEGHVNLEAWMPSRSPDVFHDKMYNRMNMLFEGEVEVVVEDVSINGNVEEWITQVDRYISERPEMDFSDGIFYFMDCEEVYMPQDIMHELADRRASGVAA